MNPYAVIRHPVSTEKAIRLMESQNKLVFTVDRSANKAAVKTAFEELFKAKVVNVTTSIHRDGTKRAYIKLSPQTPAIDIATQLGMM